MTRKNDRIVRLEALLEKIRERSAQPRGMNGVAAGEGVAHWAPEDTEIRISTTFDDGEPLAAEAREVHSAADLPPSDGEAYLAAGETLSGQDLAFGAEHPAFGADESSPDHERIHDEPDSFPAAMLDEYEVSDDVVEINVDAEDDSVRTSVVPSFEVPSFELPPVEVVAPDVPLHDALLRTSTAPLAAGSGAALSDSDEMIVNETDLVAEDVRVDDVTVDVDEEAEAPSSSRRPIPPLAPATDFPGLADLPPLADLPTEEGPPLTPPPASGKQIAAAEYSFEPAPETLHPVGPIELQPRRDPVLSATMRSEDATFRSADDAEPMESDVPRQIWKATSPPPQVEPETFGAWLDATLSL